MSAKSKKLAIITTSPLAVVQPPPTKAEIMDAMVQLQIERNLKARAETDAKIAELTPKAEDSLIKWFLKNIKDVDKDANLGRMDQFWDSKKRQYIRSGKIMGATVVLRVPDTLPDSLAKMIREIRDLEDKKFTTDPKEVRRELMEVARGGDQSERVSKLLADPEARKALEAALDKVT